MNRFRDYDWAGCGDIRKSTTGIVVTINSSKIFWTSKGQTIVCLSSAESEYVSISKCAKHLTTLRRLFYEFCAHEPCYGEPFMHPTLLLTDNLASNLQVSERNMHIEIRFDHVRDLIINRKIKLEHIKS